MPILRVLMRMASRIPCWKYLCSTIVLIARRIPLRHEQKQVDIHLHGSLSLWRLWCLLDPPPPSSIMAQSPLQACSLQQNSCSGLLHQRCGVPCSSPRPSIPENHRECFGRRLNAKGKLGNSHSQLWFNWITIQFIQCLELQTLRDKLSPKFDWIC